MSSNWDNQVKLYTATLGEIVNYKPDITYNITRVYPNGKKHQTALKYALML